MRAQETSTSPLKESQDWLNLEFSWLEALIRFRIGEIVGAQEAPPLPPVPPLSPGAHPFSDALLHRKARLAERLALSLALAAQSAPWFLDDLFTKNQLTGQPFTEFGINWVGTPSRIQPTWQTVAFLFQGATVPGELLPLIHGHHWIYREKWLERPPHASLQPSLMPLLLDATRLFHWLSPIPLPAAASLDFPAQELTSNLQWKDLFLAPETQQGLKQFRKWLEHSPKLWAHSHFHKHIVPGIRVLFHGPPGTGKSLTAALLGKQFQMPVYRVDLSQIVSKWIGETEKNLARLFDQAEHKGWILFFDEAEALFSRRTDVHTSNDRRANQEVAFILQRIEQFEGTVILATNLREQLDDAFTRRFQLIIPFPVPEPSLRHQMWQNLWETAFPLHPDLDLEEIAHSYELTGGSMKNVFREVVLEVMDRDPMDQIIHETDVIGAIQQELGKSGAYRIDMRY